MTKLYQMFRFVKGKSTLEDCLPALEYSTVTCNIVDRKGSCILSTTAPIAVIEGYNDLPDAVVFRSTINHGSFTVERSIMSKYKLERIEGEGNIKQYIFHYVTK